MFLSIIIPVYNAERYLAECLDSCLNQALPPEDYEILCIDDGSADGSAEIMSTYGKSHPNVRVFTKENGGVSSARNLGLNHAQGDYIWFVDADDVITSGALSVLFQQAKAANMPERIKFLAYEFSGTFDESVLLQSQKPLLDGTDNLITLNLLSLNRLKKLNLRFRDDISYGEDTLMLYQFIKDGVTELKLRVPFYCVRYHDSSATKSVSTDSLCKQVYSYFSAAQIYKDDVLRSQKKGEQNVYAADQMMMLYRKGLEACAQLPLQQRREQVSGWKRKKAYPIHQPSYCTYTWRQCANEPSGTGKLRNLFRYYSIYPWGLFLASVPYSAQRAKIRASRAMRANPIMNRALNLKNRLLGR